MCLAYIKPGGRASKRGARAREWVLLSHCLFRGSVLLNIIEYGFFAFSLDFIVQET